MTTMQRFRSSRLAVALAFAMSLAGGGYLLYPSGHTIAQTPAATAPPTEAMNHANALSDAFRNSADKVLPAVVSIRNEVQPKLAKNDAKTPRGQRPQLPKGFGEQDPVASASWIRCSASSSSKCPKVASLKDHKDRGKAPVRASLLTQPASF